ncbi:Uncharacterized protein DBV15_12100 [Temnothorax longispinosus]|uniref:glutathione transferase n=1 Tax=Temnothorax longispinosus TaxID=300112 RepID=A0A4S2L289_9HYME|nr:Uncharacterized protein DBV15_12100 [Temnothorax longispinosus]
MDVYPTSQWPDLIQVSIANVLGVKNNSLPDSGERSDENKSTNKLTYFNIGCVGEPTRYLLSYCDIKFDDVRLSLEEWPKHKPNMPMGQLPILKIDGKTYHQSRAIARFIAKRSNLYGSDEFEAMEIDATVDSIEDIRQALGAYY